MTERDRGARGQATVEFALVLPLILGLLLFGVQVGLVVRDEIMVINAAREGARAAAVDPSDGVARDAAERSGALDPARLQVHETRAGGFVTVSVRYRSRTTVAIVGALVDDVMLEESTTMRVESVRW